MSGSPPELSVILVSYNTREMTLDCVATLYRSLAGLSAEVWLVDNASTDGTVEAVADAFPQVQQIINTTNIGFGAANNQALRLATGQYILLLNTDAFPEHDALRRLVDFLRTHPEVGVVGPRLLNADGSHQHSVHGVDRPRRAWSQYLGLSRLIERRGQAHPESTRLLQPDLYLKGACLMLRREVYERVGGFDERFFFYGDEADWQKRMTDVGVRLAYVDEARVKHLVGKSGTTSRLRYTLHYYASRDQFIRKHFGVTGLVSYRLAVAFWCGRKLAQQAWWWLRPGRKVNPFAVQVHTFLLRTIFLASDAIAGRISLAEPPAPAPTAADVSGETAKTQYA